MYQAFYGLHTAPFQISTDPTFLWLGKKYQEALASLCYGINQNKGFLLLTGEVGTGKTTLIHALLERLPPTVLVAVITNPNLQPLDFFNVVSNAFSLGCKHRTKGEFFLGFEEFIMRESAVGRQLLLIVDEAQSLKSEIMEEIRLLSNIERPGKKILNIFFLGHPEFNDTLLAPENKALRQRIAVKYILDNLTSEETGEYIQHRLRKAGTEREIFPPETVSRIHRFSGGYPRLVNIICDHVMVTGFVAGAEITAPEMVEECARELEIREQGHSLYQISPVPEDYPTQREDAGKDEDSPIEVFEQEIFRETGGLADSSCVIPVADDTPPPTRSVEAARSTSAATVAFSLPSLPDSRPASTGISAAFSIFVVYFSLIVSICTFAAFFFFSD